MNTIFLKMQNIKEQLFNIHPVFRIPSTRIFWADNVLKKNTHNSLQSRYLVIASPGIFLFERKTFPKGLAISRIIPYCDLVLITAKKDETFEFFKAKVTMRLQHQSNAEVVAMAISIRDVLFGDKPRYPKLVFDEPTRKRIENSNFIFETDSLLADRFISLSLETPVKHLIYDQLFEYYEKLKNFPSSFSINAEMLASNLISPLSSAIAYDKEIQSLQLDGINLSSFVEYLKPIVLYNSSIQNLILTSVNFNDNLLGFTQIWDQKTACQINFFSFLHCQLVSTNFITFLSAFPKYKIDVQTLLFISCHIDRTILEKILIAIITSKCFLGLTELYFNDLTDNIPLEPLFCKFFGSPFIKNHKNLKNLSLINCNLKLDKILPTFMLHIKSIRYSNFSGNYCLSDVQIPNFGLLDEIDLSSCSFTSSSLCSFFKCFADSQKHIPSQVSFNELKMSDKDWTDFYNIIATPEFNNSFGQIPNLKMFSWCSNKMNGKQVENFMNFLSEKLPEISELGLSFSIPNNEVDSSLPYLFLYFENHTIRKLDFRGESNSFFGPKMEPLLKSLLDHKTIKMLDITGQRAGPRCYEFLIKMVETCLEELRFDNNLPNDVEVLKNILNKILGSKLNYADWPANDIKECVSKMKLALRSATVTQFKELRKVYKQKYVSPNKLSNAPSLDFSSSSHLLINENNPESDYSNTNIPFYRQRSTSILKSKLKNEGSIKRISTRTQSTNLQFLMTHPKTVDNAIIECFGEEGVRNEPLIKALELLDKESSINSFLSDNK